MADTIERQSSYSRLYKIINGMNVSKEDDPAFFEIAEIFRTFDDEDRMANLLSMLAYNYLKENRKAAFGKNPSEKMEVVFGLLCVNDVELARSLDLPYDIPTVVDRLKVEIVKDNDATIRPLSVEEGLKVNTIRKLYDNLNKNDPFLHKNSKPYKAMMKSIKAMLEYVDANKHRIDYGLLDEMNNKIFDDAKAYIEAKKANVISDLGQLRMETAFALLNTISEFDTGEVVEETNDRAREEANNFFTMLTGAISNRNPDEERYIIDDIMAKRCIDSMRIDEELLKKSMEGHQALFSGEGKRPFKADQFVAQASYIVERGILHKLQTTDWNKMLTKEEFQKNYDMVADTDEFRELNEKYYEDDKVDLEKFYREFNKLIMESKQKEANKADNVKTNENVDINTDINTSAKANVVERTESVVSVK